MELLTDLSMDREIDQLCLALSLEARHPAVSAYVFERLVDLLVEQVFADLRRRFLDGQLSRRAFVNELAATIEQCRIVGLVPQAPNPH